MCKPCHNQYTRDHYKKNKQYYKEKAARSKKKMKEQSRDYLFNHFLNNPCVDCGETDFNVLTFDHVRGDKICDVSKLIAGKIENLIQEIEKCEVRCANCHLRKTRTQFGWHTYVPIV